MSNEMRDRLVELLLEADVYDSYGCKLCNDDYSCTRCYMTKFADHLIENGVIVPPCKVGDKVYRVCTFVDDDFCEGCEFYYGGGMGDMPCCDATRYGQRKKECIVVCEEVATEKEIYWWLYMNAFGKTVFLIKEEAEQKLKEMRCDNDL